MESVAKAPEVAQNPVVIGEQGAPEIIDNMGALQGAKLSEDKSKAAQAFLSGQMGNLKFR